MDNNSKLLTQRYCREHDKFLELRDGMSGEHYYVCPIGGWDCKVTVLTWDKEAGEMEAWEALKAKFETNCPDKANWIVDEKRRMLLNTKTTQGINSCAYPNWKEIARRTPFDDDL